MHEAKIFLCIKFCSYKVERQTDLKLDLPDCQKQRGINRVELKVY